MVEVTEEIQGCKRLIRLYLTRKAGEQRMNFEGAIGGFERRGLPSFARNFVRKHCAMSARVVITIALRVRRVSDGVQQFVRCSVGAPTTHACAGNGSHHSENISPGRSRPPGEFFGALLGTDARRCWWRPATEEPLRFDARGALARPDLVRRKGNAGVGAYPAGGIAGVFSQGAERLRSEHRPGGHQRSLGTHSAGA